VRVYRRPQGLAGPFEFDCGAFFLDEIGEVPLMQAKLLRALQKQKLERLYDTRTRRVVLRER
jgi:transcriptional regulator with GAF, ATPase, and Fis domain